MQPRLDILPPPQRALWDSHAANIPSGWVLYGGTAIALHLGHRQSVDFDFFSDTHLDEEALRTALPFLEAGQVLHRAPNTLTCSIPHPLTDGLAAASALFPRALNALDAAKAVAWFKDGDLETKLPEEMRRFLTDASTKVDPAAIRAMPRVSDRLSARADTA